MDSEHSVDESATTSEKGSGVGAEQLLSIGEAALRYGVSARKINKLVYENQLDGARKVRGVHGMEWRIPVAELEARGFQQQDEPGDGAPPEIAELQRSIRLLTDRLVQERQRWSDKQHELETALLQIGELRGQLHREQLRRQQAERKLAELTQETAAAHTTLDLRTAEEQSVRQR